MSRRRKWFRALPVAGTLTAIGGGAGAEPAQTNARPEPVSIVVEAPNACVTARDFFDLVRRRTPRIRRADAAEPARRYRLTIEDDQPVVGRLVAENTDGTLTPREVEGASCQEVADALALVLAVTLDPLAELGPAQARPLPGPPERPSPPRVVYATASQAHFQHAIGAEATIAAGLVNKAMPGLGARYWGSLVREGAGSMLFTVGVFATLAADAAATYPGGGAIRYRLQALSADGCPLGARIGARVGLYPCIALTVGRLQAQGIDLPGQQSDTALFVAAGLGGRWMIRLAGPLDLLGAAGLSIPLGKYPTVVTRAEQPVGGTKPVGFTGALGVGFSTP